MSMLKHLDHKVIVISSTALLLIVLLAVNSIVILLRSEHDAGMQIRDSQQGAINADYDVGLVRAAGEVAAYAITRREAYRDEAIEALQRAHKALEGLRRTLGTNPPTEGLEGKHLGFVNRQRGLLTMVEGGLAEAEKLGAAPDKAPLSQVLDAIFAYEGPAETLRTEVSAHRTLEATTNAREMQNDAKKLIYAFMGNLVVVVALTGIALAFTRRFVVKPINRLARAASAVAGGDFGQRVVVTGKDEMGHLQTAFNQMIAELRESREQLRSFAANLDSEIETERARIAHALHDELGQNLTALGIHLSNVQKQSVDLPNVTEITRRMQRIIADTGIAMRRIIADLRPLALDNFGIAVAAEALAHEFANDSGLKVNIHVDGEFEGLPDAQKTALYRMLQESLTNIAKHAQAKQIDIELARRDGGVALTVRDDGRGFSRQAPAQPGSYGLFGMAERAAQRDGKVTIDTVLGGGTKITFWLPLSDGVPA